MKLRIKESLGLGIYIIDIQSGEIYESGYDNLAQAKKALKNFKEMWG